MKFCPVFFRSAGSLTTVKDPCMWAPCRGLSVWVSSKRKSATATYSRCVWCGVASPASRSSTSAPWRTRNMHCRLWKVSISVIEVCVWKWQSRRAPAVAVVTPVPRDRTAAAMMELSPTKLKPSGRLAACAACRMRLEFGLHTQTFWFSGLCTKVFCPLLLILLRPLAARCARERSMLCKMLSVNVATQVLRPRFGWPDMTNWLKVNVNDICFCVYVYCTAIVSPCCYLGKYEE